MLTLLEHLVSFPLTTLLLEVFKDPQQPVLLREEQAAKILAVAQAVALVP